MARDGMANLIKRLRSMTDTSATEYTVNSVQYWTDDQLQEKLDMFRTDLERVSLRSVPEYVDGDSVYYDYYTPDGTGNFEEVASGSDVWSVRDGDGTLIATANYAVNYVNGHIRFTSDQDGEDYYLRARMYDVNQAAAAVWRAKAAHYVSAYDVKTDNHSLSRSQLRAGALEMAGYYESQSGLKVLKLERSDLL